MQPLFLVVAVALLIAQIALPRRLAFLPLLIAGCHLANIEIVANLTIGRILILLGLVRAVSGGFFQFSYKGNKIDRLFVWFSVIAIAAAAGHSKEQYNPWIARVGLVWNVFGAYLYGRAYLPDLAAFKRFALALPLILLPLAVGMTIEQSIRKNLYSALGSAQPNVAVRDGKVRAQGPFRHPILAGTAGATTLALAYLTWRRRSKVAGGLGIGACMGVTMACASSGPLAAFGLTFAAGGLWRWRRHMRKLVWGGLAFALVYNVIKGRGPWYIMASLDLVGGSTGWHRAKLIDQAWKYLGEWWLLGTDYTRHWMATGVSWNPNHVDITNYYLHIGVTSGLGVVVLLIAILIVCFKQLGARMAELRARHDPEELTMWCAGTALAAHAISCVSISYFDQMYILFYVLIASINAISSVPITASIASAAPVKSGATA